MVRKLVVLAVLVVMLVVPFVASASNPSLAGCYVDAPASVNEGATYTATIQCNLLVAVFGTQFGTTLTGNGTTAATSYTHGTFYTSATSPIVASNTLSLYAISRTGTNTATGNFTMGSFQVTANKGLTTNGSITVDLPASGFKLSNILGGIINGLLQVSPAAVTTVTDIPLAILNGNVRVSSDGTVGALAGIDLNMGDGITHWTNQTAVGVSYRDFTLSALEYTAATKPALGVTVSVDMTSHLACSSAYTLDDGGNTTTAKVGTSGVVSLKAGDVVSVSGDTAINIQDATAIGAQFSSTSPTGEVDVNRDGVIDIYDLVHVGRNYGATQGACI